MAKKDQIYLPSLTKSVPGKVTWIPLTTKLEKHNIEFLKEHGYPVEQSVNQCTYKTIPEQKFTSTKLYLYMFFQDICRGSFFNSFRYPYYLVFLKDIYNKTLNSKQLQIYKEFLASNRECSINDKEGNFKLISASEEQKTVGVEKIILFSSNTVGIGKTTTSNKLVEALDSTVKISFMDATRQQLFHIFNQMGLDGNYWREPLYSKNKNIKQNFNSDYEEFVQRTLLCDYSDLLQAHFGKDCWAKATANKIDDTEAKYVVIDDLRRPIELDYFIKKYGKENILTVYLTKENSEDVVLSASSSSYEGLLDPSTFDIQFKFTSDWNNTNELITTIKSKLVR